MLPRYVGRGKTWFWDEKLGQLRNVDDPHDFINPFWKYDGDSLIIMIPETRKGLHPYHSEERFTLEPERKMIYVVVVTDGYIPDVAKVSTDRMQALNYAMEYASEWENAEMEDSGRIYFNQEESGNMDKSISVIESEVEG